MCNFTCTKVNHKALYHCVWVDVRCHLSVQQHAMYPGLWLIKIVHQKNNQLVIHFAANDVVAIADMRV